MESFEHRVHKDKQRGWKASTRINLTDHQVLEVSTYQALPPTRALRTRASVSRIQNGFECHVVGNSTFGDFSAVLIDSHPKRVTEKQVREQHDCVFSTLGFLDALKMNIHKHYEDQHQAKHGSGTDFTLEITNVV